MKIVSALATVAVMTAGLGLGVVRLRDDNSWQGSIARQPMKHLAALVGPAALVDPEPSVRRCPAIDRRPRRIRNIERQGLSVSGWPARAVLTF